MTETVLEVGFNITLDSHHINHSNSKLNIEPIFPEFGIEFRCINKVLKEMANFYARLVNHYIFEIQTMFSARFDEQNGDGLMLGQIKLYFNLNIRHNLTESDLDNIIVRFALEEQIQRQEIKNSVWRFDIINSMTIYFNKS